MISYHTRPRLMLVSLYHVQIMIFDLTDMDVVEVELWSSVMAGSILSGRTMEELVSEVTLITGRMLSPPSWTQKVCMIVVHVCCSLECCCVSILIILMKAAF